MFRIKALIRRLAPKRLVNLYHWLWAYGQATRYGHPSRQIKIVGITGTKGKSSCTEIIDQMLRAGGHKTAVAGTIRFSVGDDHESNLLKQSMPGRGYLQKHLRRAVDAGCDWAVIEMTSEGSVQYRNRFIELDCLVVTNLRPEHLESHGGFENYKRAKLDIVKHSLAASSKRPRALIVNSDDEHHESFKGEALVCGMNKSEIHTFAASSYESSQFSHDGIRFEYESNLVHSSLVGEHNLSNLDSAIKVGEFAGMTTEQIIAGIRSVSVIPGRGQSVDMGQPFRVIVDYAHTNDSLEAMYKAWSGTPIIGILGACGGGRDRWKRPDFGRLADEYCKYVVLTNEDPYDEDPMQIIEDMESGMDKSHENIRYKKILDRREAFIHAFSQAEPGDVILITGKGTDPYIMGPNGTREAWSDLEVARETLSSLGHYKASNYGE